MERSDCMIIHENNEDERKIYLWFTEVRMDEFLNITKDLELHAGLVFDDDIKISYFHEGAEVIGYISDEWFEGSNEVDSDFVFSQLESLRHIKGVYLIVQREGNEIHALYHADP